MKHQVTLFAMAVLLAFIAGQSHCAYAQVFDRMYAKSLILGGGPSGIDLTHTLTISAGTLTSNEPLTLPVNNAMGVLNNNGSGVLSWSPITVSSFDVGAGNSFLITSSVPSVSFQAFTIDGTTLTGNGLPTATNGTPLVINLANANTWTAAQNMQQNSIGSTSTDALILSNTTSAVSGTQEYSPRLHLIGEGWKTNSTAGSEEIDWIAQTVPVQGTANPTSYLDFEDGIANAGYASDLDVFSSGGATIRGFIACRSHNGSAQLWHRHPDQWQSGNRDDLGGQWDGFYCFNGALSERRLQPKYPPFEWDELCIFCGEHGAIYAIESA